MEARDEGGDDECRLVPGSLHVSLQQLDRQNGV